MKSIWLSALSEPAQQVGTLLSRLKTYGLEPSAHQWEDDLSGMAWMGPLQTLDNPHCALWAIMAAKAALVKPETRYGLSLLALCLRSRRGPAFPIVILQTDPAPLSAEELPTPLENALILPAMDPGTPAKLVARAHARSASPPADYHFDMVGNPQLGQWFELRPTRDQWPGIIFGVDEGEIKFQAVGPAGALPASSTLNYPMQGIRIDHRERTFTAWAVRNPITPETAYYVKIEGTPATLLFGAFSDAREAEMFVIRLR